MSRKSAKVELDVKLLLPDSMAKEARESGLLEPDSLEALLREELRRRRVDRLFAAADRLSALLDAPLTEEEVEVEIQAARAPSRFLDLPPRQSLQ
jgi:hypothetical protein